MTDIKGRLTVVQGGQYGSEAKGAVTAAICEREGVEYCVRTGTINAGHTVYFEGRPYKMQQIPVGWVKEGVKLVIGPGACVHVPILLREARMVHKALTAVGRHMPPIVIDPRATLHEDHHMANADAANRHHLIGTTGKGCSEAMLDKVRMRGKRDIRVGAVVEDLMRYKLEDGPTPSRPFVFADVSNLLHDVLRKDAHVVLEGTQGSHLDLVLGPWPYVTHKQTQAAQWIQEAGLPSAIPHEVVLVVRTYPIRVAGNSGPLPGETSWLEVARSINRRLEEAGLPPRVQEASLREFELTLERAPFDYMSAEDEVERVPPYGLAPLAHQHLLRSPQARERNRELLSESQRWAMDHLPPQVVEDLCRVFEMTTVTQKLRRVAHFHPQTVRQSVRWNAPSRLALTFYNYWFPQTWGQTASDLDPRDIGIALRDRLPDDLREMVHWVSTGPETANLIRV